MFNNSTMKEGNQLAQNGHVTIPSSEDDTEDDAEAMTVICNIFHHSNASVATEVNAKFLYDVAVLSDKYDTNVALKPTVTTWVRDYVFDLGVCPNISDEGFDVRTSRGKAGLAQLHETLAVWKQSRINTWATVLLSAWCFKHHGLARKAMQGLVLCCHHPALGIDTQEFPIRPELLGKS
jgi:hypothetical protein